MLVIVVIISFITTICVHEGYCPVCLISVINIITFIFVIIITHLHLILPTLVIILFQ